MFQWNCCLGEEPLEQLREIRGFLCGKVFIESQKE